MTKMPEPMMLAPYVLKMSDIEDIVNAVGLKCLDKQKLQKRLAHALADFRATLNDERKIQGELKRMISCVDALRKSANSIIDALSKHGYFAAVSLRYGAKKQLLKKEHDPSRLAEIAFDPNAGDELIRQQISQVAEFVAFVNDVCLEMKKEHGLSSSKLTSETHRRLFHDELYEVYREHFPSGTRLQFNPIEQKHFGPYLRFCVAVADKYGIETRNGRRYAESSIAEFIRDRPPRSHRSRGQRRAVQAKPDTG